MSSLRQEQLKRVHISCAALDQISLRMRATQFPNSWLKMSSLCQELVKSVPKGRCVLFCF